MPPQNTEAKFIERTARIFCPLPHAITYQCNGSKDIKHATKLPAPFLPVKSIYLLPAHRIGSEVAYEGVKHADTRKRHLSKRIGNKRPPQRLCAK